jgi:hypothetical protein
MNWMEVGSNGIEHHCCCRCRMQVTNKHSSYMVEAKARCKRHGHDSFILTFGFVS